MSASYTRRVSKYEPHTDLSSSSERAEYKEPAVAGQLLCAPSEEDLDGGTGQRDLDACQHLYAASNLFPRTDMITSQSQRDKLY